MDKQTREIEKVSEIIESKTLQSPVVYIDPELPEEKKKEIAERANKLYLVLWEINDLGKEVEKRDYEYVRGTQVLYDHIKELLENEEDDGIIHNISRSLVIVESEKVTISKAMTVYRFMTLMRERQSVVDESSFDINDYLDYGEDEDESEVY